LTNSETEIVRQSGLFDGIYYLNTYPDVARSKIDPLIHFCLYGYREGRNPSASFNTEEYKKLYPECGNTNPVIHAVRKGVKGFTRISVNPVVKPTPPAQTSPSQIPKVSPLSLEERMIRLRQKPLQTYAPVSSPTAIIPTAWKCPHWTLPLLEHLEKHSVPVVLVWTAPTNPPEFSSNVKVVLYRNNPFNYGKALNKGAKKAKGDVFLFLNDDFIVSQDDWIERWLEAFSDPTVALAAPVILNPDRSIQRAGIVSTLNSPHEACVTINTRPNGIRDVVSCGGPAIAVRKEAFSGFDEDLILYCSDDAIGLTASRCVVTSASEIIHHQSTTAQTTPPSTYNDVRTFWTKYWDRLLAGLPKPNIPVHYPKIVIAEDIRHIVAVRVDHIGDTILSLDGVRTLRHLYPNARITVLCGTWAMPFLQSLGFDDLIPYDFYEEGGSAARIRAVPPEQMDVIRKLKPDIAYNFRGDSHGVEALLVMNATITASFSDKTDFRLQCDPSRKSIRQSFLELAICVPTISRSGLKVPKGDAVGIHPFGSIPNKQYPPDRIRSLIHLLKERHIPVLLFGPPDRQEELKAFDAPCAPVVPISEYADLVYSLCKVYVGMDSGPTHIVGSAGMPTVDIMHPSVHIPFCIANGPAVVGLEMSASPHDILWAMGRALDLHRRSSY